MGQPSGGGRSLVDESAQVRPVLLTETNGLFGLTHAGLPDERRTRRSPAYRSDPNTANQP